MPRGVSRAENLGVEAPGQQGARPRRVGGPAEGAERSWPGWIGGQNRSDLRRAALEQHPDTIFQSAHVASASEDLGYVSSLLDRYPNLHVDISARIAELGRQPCAARAFFLKYPDRILYGTDVQLTAAWQRVFMRFLETRDEHFPYSLGDIPSQGRWRISGVGLPDEVLEKVYCGNAERLYGEAPRQVG